jgi:hypothetical protein
MESILRRADRQSNAWNLIWNSTILTAQNVVFIEAFENSPTLGRVLERSVGSDTLDGRDGRPTANPALSLWSL